MLSAVKMLLKGEAGSDTLNSHGNYIVDHGQSWKNHGIVFLAHLSRRLMGELIVYQSLRRPSVVRPSSVRLSVRLSTFSNIFSSETTGPIKLKFHMETP